MLHATEAPSSSRARTIGGVNAKGRFGGSFTTKGANVATNSSEVTAKPADMTAEASPTSPRGQRRWGEGKTQRDRGRRGCIY
jgi:hypothetical protein